jgi:iron complex outermembrane receptor protein
MKVFKSCLLCIAMCMFYKSYGQTQSAVIQGSVYVADEFPAEAATVLLLLRSDSSIVRSAITDKAGRYEMRNIKSGTYYIKVNKLSCAIYNSPDVQITTPKIYTAEPIILKSLDNQLKGIIVNEKKQFIEIRPDKTILNISDNSLATGHSALEILSTAPGVRLSSNDEILFKAGQKALVIVNGKTTHLTGQDLSGLLQNMQSSEIEKIELIANPSSRFDAGGAGGVINIILKKHKSLGANASVSAGAGYGNYYKSNAGINFNYRGKAVNFFGNTTFVNNKTDRGFLINRNVNYLGQTTNFDVDYKSKQTGPASNFRVGADFFIDSLQTIGFAINGFFNHYNFDKTNTTNIGKPGGPIDSALNTVADLNRHIGFANYNINYSGAIGTSGTTISADADHSEYRRRSFEKITPNPFYNFTAKTIPQTSNLSNVSPAKISITSFKADLMYPFSKSAKLEAGLKYSTIKSDNVQDFKQLLNTQYQTIPFLTDHFLYNESFKKGYLNYIKKSKVLSYSVGATIENTDYAANLVKVNNVVKRNFTKVFPYGQIDFKPNRNNLYSLGFTSRLDRPTYEELNPFIAYQDRYNFTAGNPYLLPDYFKSVQFTHTYKSKYVTNVYASLVTDAYNFSFFSQNDTTKVNTATKKNLGRIYTYGVQFIAPVHITSFWNATLDADAEFLRYTTYQVNGTLNRHTTDILIKTTHAFTLPGNFTADISISYETPAFWGIMQLKENFFVNGGIGTTLFKKAGSLRLNIDDFFDTRRSRFSTTFANLDLTGYQKAETRIFRLNFTYRFGKSTVKSARRRTSGNDEEQKRLGGN